MTYFRRYRMEWDLSHTLPTRSSWFDGETSRNAGYSYFPYDDRLIRDHAQAKFQSFRGEMDANVFPCLGRRDGCLRLMQEIVDRASFVPAATWLLVHRDRIGGRPVPVGTIQGLEQEGWGAVQNLGVAPEHRGRGLGSQLLMRAAEGFKASGLQRIHLEVTTANASAVRLYERLGFRRVAIVYKACDVAGAD